MKIIEQNKPQHELTPEEQVAQIMAWERAMARTFRGIFTRAERRRYLERALEKS
jgi:hypothetical protein